MIISRSLTLTTTPASLASLLGIQNELRGSWSLKLQTPAGNTDDVFIGSAASQDLALPADTVDFELYGINLKDIYVRADGQTLVVLGHAC